MSKKIEVGKIYKNGNDNNVKVIYRLKGIRKHKFLAIINFDSDDESFETFTDSGSIYYDEESSNDDLIVEDELNFSIGSRLKYSFMGTSIEVLSMSDKNNSNMVQVVVTKSNHESFSEESIHLFTKKEGKYISIKNIY